MTQIRYTVHSVEEQDVKANVELNGEVVEASVPGLVIELVSKDGTMGHTLRLVPNAENKAAAELLFQKDAEVIATFTAAE